MSDSGFGGVNIGWREDQHDEQIASISRADLREFPRSSEYMCKLAFFQNPLTSRVDQFLLSPIFWDTHGGSGCRPRTNKEQIYRMPSGGVPWGLERMRCRMVVLLSLSGGGVFVRLLWVC
jgi:hypothetical protein